MMGFMFSTTIIIQLACFVISVDAQLLNGTCRRSVTCNEVADDIVATTSLEDCCLNTDGLAFRRVDSCIPCIVFGFFEDSFTGIEQGPGHTMKVGWQKGAAQAGVNLVFNVFNMGLTASEGSHFDYIINTNQVTILHSRPEDLPDVVVIFRVDGIAQESNETLILELVRASGSAELPIGDGVFFRNNITMTIIDSDTVDILFADDDFQANEASENGTGLASFIPVRVIKTSKIANPIVLDVIPLTVDEARANTPPALPANIPTNNPFSPPFADLNDFNNTVIRITFDPDDHEVNEDNERAAPIRIVDDLVNEAYEQVFIVQLRLVSSTNSSAIDLTTTPASICKIINDDAIRIGFALPQYTYIEPMFDTTIDESDYTPPNNKTANGFIYIMTEDNVVSEQTFRILVRTSNSVPSLSGFNPATLGTDYTFGIRGTSVISFEARNQRIVFSFTLLTDNLVEKTKAFHVSLESERSTILPHFLSPQKLFSDTFVIIEDDDPIIIGFEQTVCRVNESIGILDVFVSISNLAGGEELYTTIDLTVHASSTNATRGVDYDESNVNNSIVLLHFDDNTNRRSFQVTIIDDVLCESIENFTLELMFDLSLPLPSRVILSPNVSTVYILDDDNITIGFINPPYSVYESESRLTIHVGILQGSLQKEVVVRFSTSASTAVDANDFNSLQDLLTFDADSILFEIVLSIIDDNVYELNEHFSAALSFARPYNDSAPKVSISQEFAQITIIDDDVLLFGFEPAVYSVNESAGSTDLHIFFNGNPGVFVPHVNISTVDMTASSSGIEADYGSVVAQQFFFTSLERNRALIVQINSDPFTELNETFSAVLSYVFLASETGGAAINLPSQGRSRLILNPNTAVVTIENDDGIIIGFDDMNYTVSETVGSVALIVRVLDGVLSRDQSIPVRVITADDSARAPSDYAQVSSILTFTSSFITQTVAVSIQNDTVFEIDEVFRTTLQLVNGYDATRVQLQPNEALVTILDNDAVVIGFIQQSYDVYEGASTPLGVTVEVISGQLDREVVVTLNTRNGSATSGLDFIGVLNHQLSFTPSMTSHTVFIEITNDDIYEDEVKHFTVSLSTNEVRVYLRNMSATIVNIIDDDTITIGFLNTLYGINESEGIVNISVGVMNHHDLVGREEVVNFTTTDLTAIAGDDYVGIDSRLLTFDSSNLIVVIPIMIKNDESAERVETLSAHLSFLGQPSLGVILAPNTTTVEIYDDDEVEIGFSSSEFMANERDEQLNVQVLVKSGLLQKELAFNLHIVELTAHDGEDFITPEIHLFTLNSSQSILISVSLINDNIFELSESFIVHLTSNVSSGVSLNQSSATVTVLDDDELTFGFSKTMYKVNEDDGSVIVDIVLFSSGSSEEYQPVLVLSTNNGTATEGTDFVAIISSQITFVGGNRQSSQNISIHSSSSTEALEEFTVSLDMVTLLSSNNGSLLNLSQQEISRLILGPRETHITIVDSDIAVLVS